MRIKLLAVSNFGDQASVQFSTENGIGKAIWKGTGKPVVGQELDVEFHVDLIVDFGTNSSANEQHESGVSAEDTTTTFKGLIEGQDDDGVCYMRIFRDCILMLESLAGNLTGRWVTVTAPIELVRMFPIGG
jgi:hypothetical protein